MRMPSAWANRASIAGVHQRTQHWHWDAVGAEDFGQPPGRLGVVGKERSLRGANVTVERWTCETDESVPVEIRFELAARRGAAEEPWHSRFGGEFSDRERLLGPG